MSQQVILDSLRDKGPEAWLAYLRPFKESGAAPGLSSDVIFHAAAPKATEQNNLLWAEVAIRAVELSAVTQDGTIRENELMRAMRLRTHFVSTMESQPGHFVLDKELILRWAEDDLPHSVQAIEEQLRWLASKLQTGVNKLNDAEKQQVSETLKQLRRLKHRLLVVSQLAASGNLPKDSLFHHWLRLQEQLP